MAAANFTGRTTLQRSQTKFQKYGDEVENRIRSGDHQIYPHQIEAVFKTKEMLDRDRELNQVLPVLIVAPTGSGKSGMIALLPYILKAKKVLILTPDNVISTQLGVAFGKGKKDKNFFEVAKLFSKEEKVEVLEHVLLINKSFDVDDEVLNCVIVNAQKFTGKSSNTLKVEYQKKTLVKDVEEFFAQFDLLIVDEAHHYPAETWQMIVKAFKKSASTELQKKLVFLTATPFRSGPNGKFKPILNDSRIAFEITIRELEGAYIRKISFQEERKVSQVCNDVRAILDQQYEEEQRFKPQAMILVPQKDDALKYEKMLNKAHGPNYAVAIFGGRKEIDEEQRKNDFTNEKYRVAIVCGLLLEGYDNPKVTLCVILRNVGSPIVFSQFTGRCLRIKRDLEGEEMDKTNAVVLSYTKFNQRKMWEQREMLAEKDPVEENFA